MVHYTMENLWCYTGHTNWPSTVSFMILTALKETLRLYRVEALHFGSIYRWCPISRLNMHSTFKDQQRLFAVLCWCYTTYVNLQATGNLCFFNEQELKWWFKYLECEKFFLRWFKIPLNCFFNYFYKITVYVCSPIDTWAHHPSGGGLELLTAASTLAGDWSLGSANMDMTLRSMDSTEWTGTHLSLASS